MTAIRIIPVVLLLVGCAAENNPTQTNALGEGQIALNDGRNCWNNQCFRYSKVNRSVSVLGRHPVRVPRDIDVRDNQVSQAEFTAMFQTANMAYSTGAGRR